MHYHHTTARALQLIAHFTHDNMYQKFQKIKKHNQCDLMNQQNTIIFFKKLIFVCIVTHDPIYLAKYSHALSGKPTNNTLNVRCQILLWSVIILQNQVHCDSKLQQTQGFVSLYQHYITYGILRPMPKHWCSIKLTIYDHIWFGFACTHGQIIHTTQCFNIYVPLMTLPHI